MEHLVNMNQNLAEEMKVLSFTNLETLEQKLAFTIGVIHGLQNISTARGYHWWISSIMIPQLENILPTIEVLMKANEIEEFIISCELILEIDFKSSEFTEFIQTHYEGS